MKTPLLLIAGLFAILLPIWGQTLPSDPYSTLIPSSPTVAALEKFGDYPIGYHTGTVGISVDLYSFPLCSGLNLDVRLDYHSSGIKVEEVSGCTGLGWSLSAGGCISRQIRGIKDESHSNGFYDFIQTHKGYQFPFHDFANTADSIDRRILDSGPDIFHLSLPGRTCKFFFGNDGEFHTIPYSNLKIRNIWTSTGVLQRGIWEITDESGIHYIFESSEITDGGPTDINRIYASAWWLTAILSAEGNELATFEYSSGFRNHDTQRRMRTFIADDYRAYRPEDVAAYAKETILPTQTDYEIQNLRRINLPGKGSVVFELGSLGSLPNIIKEIRYYDNKNTLTNKYILSYETIDHLRVNLSQILKTGADGSTYTYRAFTYYPRHNGIVNPMSQDYWGYNNGVLNQSLYPYLPVLEGAYPGPYTSGNRYPTEKAIEGTIKEIIYPTGGKTVFEFENNKVYSPDSVFTTRPSGISHSQYDFGEVSSNSFSTADGRININIDMSIHPVGFYTLDIRLIRIDDNTTILHRTNTSVPGTDFTYMGTNANGTERFVCTLADYRIDEGTYKWTTRIISDGHPNRPKPSPILISNSYNEPIVTKTYEKLVGGLRIARILNYDSNGTLTRKVNYTYLNKDGFCSGEGAPSPQFLRTYAVNVNICEGCISPIFQEIPLIELVETDLNQYSGSAVQYTHITEEVENVRNSGEKFKRDYQYRARVFTRGTYPSPNPQMQLNYTPYSLNEYEEGLLVSRADYEFRDNRYVLVRKEYYNYYVIDFGEDIPKFKSAYLNKYNVNADVSHITANLPFFEKYQLGYYNLISAKVYLASREVKDITPQGIIFTTDDYFYENAKYHQLTRSRQTGSDGQVNETVREYCYDRNTPATNAMKNRNMLNFPICVTSQMNGRQTRQTDVSYEVFAGNIIKPGTVKERIAASASSSEMTYHSYDCYGNPVYFSRNGADETVCLWSYHGQYPIAEIKNMSYSFAEIEATVCSVFSVSSINELSNLNAPDETGLKNGSLQRALPGALVVTCTYNPTAGMTSSTDPHGITTCYEYDGFQRLKRVYIKDASGREQTVSGNEYNYYNQ